MNTTSYNNYVNYYNPFQTSLPLDINTIVFEDEEVLSFVDLMGKVNLDKYFKVYKHRGNQGYNPTMMIMVILFAFTNNIYSLRKIEKLCRNDLRFLYLSGFTMPSHQAFFNFIKDNLVDTIENIFHDINKVIIDLDNVNTDVLFIDGTKLEANAHKNSFVWKKAVVNNQLKLFRKIDFLIDDINLELSLDFPKKEKYSLSYVTLLYKTVFSKAEKDEIVMVHGKGSRKTPLQRICEKAHAYLDKLLEYTIHFKILKDRNSYSKIDYDATFMNMKYDYYNRTGVFKPGYNVQIGVSDYYILHVDIFQRPSDSKTFIPFMDGFKKAYGYYPIYPVGDAGYGSYDNYSYCLENNMKLAMKDNYYNKRNNSKKFKKEIHHYMNLKRLEDGTRICAMGHPFDIFVRTEYSKTTVYPKKDYIFECSECFDCSCKSDCTKAKGNKVSRYNPTMDMMLDTVDELLNSKYGEELRKNRCAQVEGAFGVLKQNYFYNRVRRRGLKNVKAEIILTCLGFNIKKYISKQGKKTNPENLS